MGLDATKLSQQMLGAALPILKKSAGDIKSFAELEFAKIAHTIVYIGEQLALKKIKKKQAALLLDMQKHASRSVLLTVEGLGILAVEEAINAALQVVSAAVNTSVGFALL